MKGEDTLVMKLYKTTRPPNCGVRTDSYVESNGRGVPEHPFVEKQKTLRSSIFFGGSACILQKNENFYLKQKRYKKIFIRISIAGVYRSTIFEENSQCV